MKINSKKQTKKCLTILKIYIIISLEVNFRIYSLGKSTDFLREMEVKKF